MAATAQTSSFFKLPPEIRNRIYTYVLGGEVLHIFWTTGKRGFFVHNYVCRAEVTDEKYVREIKTYDGSKAGGTLEKRHAKCSSRGEDNDDRYSVSLLLSCPQIYQEASLIPYAENTFTFGPLGTKYEGFRLPFEYFLNRLSREQASAVKAIVLLNSNEASTRRYTERANTRTIMALSNLRRLTLVVEVGEGEYERSYPFGGGEKPHLASLLELGNIPTLKSVCLCVTTTKGKPSKEHWDWWKEIEDRITKKCYEVARQKELKAKRDELGT